MKQAPLIEFRNIVKRFGNNTVLNGINLEISDQDMFGIIGISGSGKTTMLNILISFLRADAGNIYYDGRDIIRDKYDIRQIFGFASQDGSFYFKLNLLENLQYFGRLYGLQPEEIEERAEKLLSLVGLSEAKHLMAEQLSKGMQRRLDIACALIHNPKVLILDEPTEDLDPMLRKEILQLVKKINAAGTTIVITSHMLEEIEYLCTKVAILHRGKIFQVGSPNQLKSRYYKNEEIHLETQPGNYKKIAQLLGRAGIDKVTYAEHKMIIHAAEPEKVLHHIMHTVERLHERLIDVTVTKPTLEEVFKSVTKK